IQSGDLDTSDSLTVEKLISNDRTKIYPEAYRLTQPFSPHKSAAIDGITIDPEKIVMPQTSNVLIIEGAGGLMVPLNSDFLMIDLIKKLGSEAILVSQNYLGSINHTLLSVQALKQHGIPIKGIIFNGEPDTSSQDYILQYSGIRLLGYIPQYPHTDKEAVLDACRHISLE
ncbi:MAG TPA: dethiobiotin synthase, partial [Mucilaginibacter sp.]|nr:dethiobiotin synthase [Mucilaginibacter sp.]